ncbi:dynactin subunit 1-like [Styela clava]
MAEGMKIGARVNIIGKNLKGTIAYIGATMFASGKWIGVVLDVPKGKNDGTVQGKRYFECGENFGVFVRQQHINVIPQDSGGEQASELKTPKSVSKNVKRVSEPGARAPSPSQLPTPSSKTSSLPIPSSLQKPSAKSGISPPSSRTPAPVSSAPAQEETTEAVAMPQHHEPQPSALSSISALAGGVSMAEVEMLKAQAKDWKDKFEAIRLKRQADRDKLKDLEKSKLQVQQLMEFKNRMSEQNQDLSKQLREAKKEATEAVESKEHYIEEMSDVHETVEMATLDKEMAEEKVETLQVEVTSLKERVEELQTDLEIMKAEIEDKGSDGAASSYQLKQLEEQNARLKEALLRLRDLSAAEKTERLGMEKQIEKKTKELDEALNKKEKISAELEKAESVIDELKEQVDAALVAEEMVEELTDKNLTLEEKLADYEEQIHDLETMNEMNEELQENARENEMELREEVDLARSNMREARRETEAANEAINDYQDTIGKFRKLVQELQEANQDLRQQNSDDGKPEEPEIPAPAFNYQIKMGGTKAAARSIDLDLRKLEAQQANEHVKFLSMFMPGLFSKRGGDNDCVQVLLLVQRVARKAEIIAKHVADRFEVSVAVDNVADYRGARGEQLTFSTGFVNTLTQLKILMEKFETALGHCSVELFQKIGTLHAEMSPHELVLDVLAEQLRKDTLDETTKVDQLTKSVDFFKHLYSVHLSKEPYLDCWKLIDEYINQSTALLQNIHNNASRMKSYLKTGQETSDIGLLLRDIDTASSDVKQFCKKLRRRIPQPPGGEDGKMQSNKLPMLKFSHDTVGKIQESENNLFKISVALNTAISQCSLQSGPDYRQLSHQELQAIFERSAKPVFTTEKDGYEGVRLSIGNVMATMNSLITSLQEGEFDTKEKRPEVSPPVKKRAQAVKSEITDSEGLATKLSDKDTVIQELRKSLKLKSAEMGETKIRIGMLERKLEKSGKFGEEQVSRLQQENDNMKEELKKKDREYDETLDTLQHDIDTLEYEKSELKQRLIAQSKRSYADVKGDTDRASPLKSNIASLLAGATTASGGTPGTQIVVEDSPLMKEQIQALEVALRSLRAEKYKLLGKSLHDRMKRLTPINVQRKTKMEKDETNTELRKLHLNLEKLKEHVVSVVCPKVVNISIKKSGAELIGSKSPSQQLVQEQLKLQIAREKVAELQIKARQLMAATKMGNRVERQFTSFPTTEFSKSLLTAGAVEIGRLSLPSDSSQKAQESFKPLVLQPEELMQLHNKVVQPYLIQQ